MLFLSYVDLYSELTFNPWISSNSSNSENLKIFEEEENPPKSASTCCKAQEDAQGSPQGSAVKTKDLIRLPLRVAAKQSPVLSSTDVTG